MIKFHALRSKEGFIVVVAKLLGICIGETSIAQMWKSEGIDEFYSGGTDVHPLFRGIGVGKRMLSIALLEAKDTFMAPIYVNIPSDNRYSLQLYRSVGFEIVERKDMQSAIENSYIERIGTTKKQVIMKCGLQ